MLLILLLSYIGLAFAVTHSCSFTKFVPLHLPTLQPPFLCLPSTFVSIFAKRNFHRYRSTDGQSPNCNTATTACGFYNLPGYNAAVSQNLYGKGPGAGPGPQCGRCWKLTPMKDANGRPIHGANIFVVKVNNLCPIQGNPLCGQSSLTAKIRLGTLSPLFSFVSCLNFIVRSANFFVVNCLVLFSDLHKFGSIERKKICPGKAFLMKARLTVAFLFHSKKQVQTSISIFASTTALRRDFSVVRARVWQRGLPPKPVVPSGGGVSRIPNKVPRIPNKEN